MYDLGLIIKSWIFFVSEHVATEIWSGRRAAVKPVEAHLMLVEGYMARWFMTGANLCRIGVCVALMMCGAWNEATAGTRYAFLVGIIKYSSDLNTLSRSENDANDVAADLEDIGFEHKNVKIANNIASKGDFIKKFNEFLKPVKAGDEIFFFYSGHGYASSSDNSNFLLFTDLKSLDKFTLERMPKDQRDKLSKDSNASKAVIELESRKYEQDYELSEIQRVGLSEKDVRTMIAAKKPTVTFMVMDACRTLGISDPDRYDERVHSGLHHPIDLEPGFAVLYSAKYGEVAYEKRPQILAYDERRNSLFTDIFRLALKRPGLTTAELAANVSFQVSVAVNGRNKAQKNPPQTPDYAENLNEPYRLIGSVGAERYKLAAHEFPCGRAPAEIEKAMREPTETGLNFAIRLYSPCRDKLRTIARLAPDGSTRPEQDDLDRQIKQLQAASAAVAKAELALKVAQQGNADSPDVSPQSKKLSLSLTAVNAVGQNTNRKADSCDSLAGSPADPTETTAGVEFERIGRVDYTEEVLVTPGSRTDKTIKRIDRVKYDFDRVIQICDQEVAVQPESNRLVYNRARAWEAKALSPAADLTYQQRSSLMKDVIREYKILVDRKYAPAMDNLAFIYDVGLGGDATSDGLKPAPRPVEAAELYKKAANQGLPLAMYHLGFKYSYGYPEGGIPLDAVQGQKWVEQAEAKGVRAAILEVGENELVGFGTVKNPRLAAVTYLKAAQAGSTEAKFRLGSLYYSGAIGERSAQSGSIKSGDSDKPFNGPDDVEKNDELAFYWFSQAAEEGHGDAAFWVARMLEQGRGIPTPQQSAAVRYWRLASESATRFKASISIQYSERIIDGRILLANDDEEFELLRNLQSAVDDGDGLAALTLARITWGNTAETRKDPVLAAKYAFKAIELAARINLTEEVEDDEFKPLTEFAAGHFLVELGHDKLANDASGASVIHPDELERLEKYYGKYDPVAARVESRMLQIPDYYYEVYTRDGLSINFWVWDWGRSDAPTDMQFRRLELERGTTYWDNQRVLYRKAHDTKKEKVPDDIKAILPTQQDLRNALQLIYDQAHKYNASFLDLVRKRVELSKPPSH